MNVCECVCARVCWGQMKGLLSLPCPREHRMETTGVSDLPSLPGVPGGTAIWHGVWMAPSSPVGWPVSFILCAYFCLQVPAAWPTVEGQREAPAGSVGKHVVTMSCRPQLKERGKQRVPCVHNLCSFPLDLDLLGLPRDPRNPLPESPSWTLTGIRCSVLGGFLKPGTCSVLIPALSTPSSWANTPPPPSPMLGPLHCAPPPAPPRVPR